MIGTPRLHLRVTDSTNLRARELAGRGAPHGTLVTAAAQASGRGRQGRAWAAPEGRSLLMSLVLRDPPPLLSLAAGVAVAEVVADIAQDGAGPSAARPAQDAVMIKWPNDVQLGAGKVAGILVEGRPHERWAVLGIGLNVAVELAQLPPEVRDRAATLARSPGAVEAVLEPVLVALERWISAGEWEILAAVRARDALLGRPVAWAAGEGIAAGIDERGRLQVDTAAGTVALDAGEVHLR